MRSWRYCSPLHLMIEQNASLKNGKGWLSSIQPGHLSWCILEEVDTENRAEFSNIPRRLAETSGIIPLRVKACDTQQRQQQSVNLHVFIVSWQQWRSQVASHLMDLKLVLVNTWYYLLKYWKSLKQWENGMLNTQYSPYKINGIQRKKQHTKYLE